jgi:hypothetical protein
MTLINPHSAALALSLALVSVSAQADAPIWWDYIAPTQSDNPQVWGPNLTAHRATNAIDPEVHTSTISGGGYYGRPNLIGTGIGDTSYIPGTAHIATLSGGYDNTNNQLAGTISGGAHHFLYNAGDHGTVAGGSYNAIGSGSYSSIGGGTHNQITAGVSSISGGEANVINQAYSHVGGGYMNIIDGYASVISGGRQNIVSAYYAFANGRENTVQSYALGSAAFGYQVESTSPGSLNVSGRGADGQSIVVNLNNRTFDAATVNLLGAGAWTTPLIPAGAVWSGSFNVTVNSDTGLVAAMRVDFASTSTRVVSTVVTSIADEIGISDPIITLSNSRVLVNVTGAAGHSLTWNAAGVISQANQ